jgi:hypothetical protein
MMVWKDCSPLIVGSALASRVSADAERGPLPYLFFSGVMDAAASARLRRRIADVLGDGYAEYVAARRAIGAVAEVIYLVRAPYGDVALLVLDAPRASGIYDALGGAVRPFHQWLERRALELFRLPPGHPGPAGYGERSEIIFRWRM